MAGIGSVVGLLTALGRVSWRDVRSLGLILGQNFFLFALVVAYQQPESAEFFFVLVAALMIFPLSANAMEKIPVERRISWPLSPRQWGFVRAGSFALSPIAWVGVALLVRAGWRLGLLILAVGAALQLLTVFIRRAPPTLATAWLHWIPKPPGALGSLMRLQWREMLRTLDPYLAFVLMACIGLYRISGKPLDPAAQRMLGLLVVLALSTETQVLFGLDGDGRERYRQLPIRGWRILLAKDLAFLVLLVLLVLPFDPVSGTAAGLAALTIGHHRSVLQPATQKPWRFTFGALLPDCALQVAAIFAVGLAVAREGVWVAGLCAAAWFGSLLLYGWRWDRQPLHG